MADKTEAQMQYIKHMKVLEKKSGFMASLNKSQSTVKPALADLDTRVFGRLIDTMVYLILFGIGMLVQQSTSSLVGVMFSLPYLWFADSLPNGQSLGKRVMGIKVVGVSTYKPCSVIQSFGRNITHWLGIFDWLSIFTKKKRRLGDYIASTIVIKN